MELKTVQEVFNKLGYSAITSSFIELPNIARITLSHNGAIYREPTGISKYYLDTSKELFYKCQYDQNGNELGICAIISIAEICGIETRNAYSAGAFAGNNY